jgi:Mor family transcriptional regulator
MKQSLKPKRDARICEQYNKGVLLGDMIKEFRISKQRIYSILSRGGIKANRIDKEE